MKKTAVVLFLVVFAVVSPAAHAADVSFVLSKWKANMFASRAEMEALGRPVNILTPCFAGTITCGQTKTGRVSVDSCESSNLYAVGYTYSGVAGQTITVSAVSFDFAMTVVVADGRPNTPATILAQKDVFQVGQTATLTYTLPFTGSYIIMVTPGTLVTFGNYSLTVTCTSAPNPTSCTENASTICLNNGRFALSVAWQTNDGKSGSGTGVKMTNDTGYFWFFGSTNVELVIKVLDGRAVNGKFWVFYGALSNVGYTLTVRDTQTGQVKTYVNPLNNLASVADTSAF
jgi:hypothetical protein